jgi:hypothetical protein
MERYSYNLPVRLNVDVDISPRAFVIHKLAPNPVPCHEKVPPPLGQKYGAQENLSETGEVLR